ncbi:hypothetical protein [Levilactobacillus yiduensis]|uniref:hypothetical protein n=1 Tax=Levilactobacillus yiduensis TaxID=2953880 RepID=UPI000EF2D82B|nr:hypothetical protein [Levilactobacillus yiduensis]AYM03172.1 hypothetical protein D8911_09270 [Levilactobacillus brevis]
MKTMRQALAIIAVTFTLGGVVEPLTAPVPDAQAKAVKVWIAPNHGHRYHYSKTCRGLNHAGKLKHVTKKWAKHHHYSLCGWEK